MTYTLRLLYILTTCFFFSTIAVNAQTETSAIKIGNRIITPAEFSQTYRKLLQSDSVKKDNAKEFLDNYIHYKLMVYAAQRMGKDTTKAFREEISGYRKELAAPYLVDKNVLEKLIQETYERMREEVKVAQVFIPLPNNASPADTMAAYDDIRTLRLRILKGEPFDQIAKNYSQDIKTAEKGGDMGFIAVLENHYAFESAAYNTPKGEISLPFRTDKGFHLIKVLEKRSSKGKVKLAHILVSVPANASAEVAAAAKQKIDEAYNYLKKNEPFEGVCRVFSTDPKTKDKGGVLNRWYEAGTLIDDKMAEAVFALKEKGEYTAPIQTSLGWHIFRLVEKKSLLKFEELAQFIREKITADASRGTIIKGNLVRKLKKDNNFQESISVKQEAFDNFYKDRVGNEDYLAKAIFTINQSPSTVREFYSFVTKLQRQLAKIGALNDKSEKDWYNLFVEDKILRYEESNLEIKYPEFRAEIQDFRDGILQKEILNDNVLEKSLDSLAQVRYFNQNAQNYQYTNRVLAKLVTTDRKETMEQAKGVLAKAPYPLNRRFPDISFEKEKSDFSSDVQKMLYDLVVILTKNREFTVEVTGNSDPEESESISAQRARKIVNYLINKGISPMRIIEKDDGKYKPVSKTDRSKNMRAGVKFFSNSMEDVVKRFNALKPGSLTAEERYFKKGENEYLDNVNWVVGESTSENKGRQVWLNILKVEEPRAKTFREARGQVMKDYQKVLFDNWINQLKSKYPVQINQEEVNRILD
ncbi:peptidyl-prolyl cis-trans isomerase SurA [Arcicella aurantiaca]|uniref:Peptidyl-prolyl cis-trans isomerase SurA n=1 Tax=Arcicella aurantiaca TaxID=591202 RepID=A0A316EZD6_9BACT|nr:peptidylprolyl isomerase [Arcicella aurantiaca]PWK28635.1 peptidyl-prolyl cis-trans isomerase SurA [Arcicella aurantiaca]